ncbi:MAG TPA: SDR family oxidoreductase [Anaerolineaceae bacterium]|nr:SDR family oxidoreductase [Anaerolineaceae bacterium]HOU42975.1 SDR family oxidoreductase [Anaerolineaceae bacterium]HQF44468.1 SDR family oxidoreductase [Anaerolineaceae bacterium]HQJ02492.1 SDR family oxidoreductase [Anaerolineaceae bacterium]
MMILVTGATGHIGNVLVRELLVRGEHIRVLLLPHEDCTSIEGLDVEKAEGDVLDMASLRKAMQGINLVYHLAGMITIMPGPNETVRRVNVDGTRNVLEAARQSGVQRVVYTSSIHAFQRVPEGILIDEHIPFDPEHAINEYDRSKATATLAALEAARHGQDVVIACPTGVIGPHDYRLSEMGKLILDWIHSKIAWLVDGAYDFVDVRDVAQGLILAAEHGKSGEIYILSGQRIDVGDIPKIMKEVVGLKRICIQFPLPVARFFARFGPFFYRLFHTKPRLTPYSIETLAGNCTISSEKARRELGFQPRSLKETMRDTVIWLQENSRLLKKVKA